MDCFAGVFCLDSRSIPKSVAMECFLGSRDRVTPSCRKLVAKPGSGLLCLVQIWDF
jgi:hypothetical protein